MPQRPPAVTGRASRASTPPCHSRWASCSCHHHHGGLPLRSAVDSTDAVLIPPPARARCATSPVHASSRLLPTAALQCAVKTSYCASPSAPPLTSVAPRPGPSRGAAAKTESGCSRSSTASVIFVPTTKLHRRLRLRLGKCRIRLREHGMRRCLGVSSRRGGAPSSCAEDEIRQAALSPLPPSLLAARLTNDELWRRRGVEDRC